MADPNRISYTIVRPEAIPTPEVFKEANLASEWSNQIHLYSEYWRWYDGKVYFENSKNFPLAMNPLRTACIMHRNALFGEVSETDAALARVEFVIEPDVDDPDFYVTQTSDNLSPQAIERKKRARRLDTLVNRVWFGSNGRSIMMESGLNSQILGGCAFGVRYSPWNLFSQIPITVELIHPHEFLPVYARNDPWHLVEAYIVRQITSQVARSHYGIEVEGPRDVLYVEHWTKDDYKITVDNKVPIMKSGLSTWKMEDKNPFGFVPFVYIPHEREGDRFYGVPVMHQLEGLLLEINGRSADVGDGIRDGSHRVNWIKNVTREITVRELDDRTVVYDLGIAPPNSSDPDMGTLDAPNLPVETAPFIAALQNELRTAEFTPGVAYGEDEGSQRSGLTLAFRMWPFSAHIRSERINWSVGLATVAEYIVRIAQVKSAVDDRLKKYAVSVDDLNLTKQVRWFPMLPRDEEAETNMAILRHQEGILSTETAVRQSDQINDADEEMMRLSREQQAQSDQQMALSQVKAKGAPTNVNPPKAANDTGK